jgi:peroxisomal coenzyme A diphosphatase NUDT7
MSNREDFLSRIPHIMGEENFQQYGVMIPLVWQDEKVHVLFEKRSKMLRRQPGEISFPGGKLEEYETTFECAIRETMEELCLEREQIEILGVGDQYLSPFNLLLHTYFCVIRDYQGTFNPDEVEEIIVVPLDYLKTHEPYRFMNHIVSELAKDFPYEWIPEGENYNFLKGTYDILFYHYKDIKIWGMTAKILQSALRLLEKYLE